MSRYAKLIAGIAGIAMVMSLVFAMPVKAATIAELQALIAQLTAQLAALSGGTQSATTFTQNLTMGSRGAEVTALQNSLINMGYSIPAGSTGYFGGQTRTALSAYQAAKGITPAVGYFGALTRASFNANTVVTPGTPGTVTPGVGTEGSFTVARAAQPADNTNITTSTNVPIYGIEFKAQNSDMTIDRADLQISVTVNSSAINPSNFYKTISAWDGSTMLVSRNLTNADFIKDTTLNVYYVRLLGIGFKVPKDATKTLTFKADSSAVSSSDYSRVVTVKGYAGSTQNIRGTDTLGLNSYGDMSGSTASFTYTASQTSTLTASADVNTVDARNVTVNTTDGVQGVEMMSFNVKSTVGESKLTKLTARVETDGAATSVPTAIYLYDGSNLLGSGSVTVVAGEDDVTFSNLSLMISKDQTKKLTIKADFPSTAAGIASTTIQTTSTGTMYDKADTTSANVTVSSAIEGAAVHLYAGLSPQWSLVSSSITETAGVVNVASSSITGTIVLKVKADGGTLTKPVTGDFSVMFASSTQVDGGYTAGVNAITLTGADVTVSPNSDVTDGSEALVTITGTLLSSDTGLTAGSGNKGAYRMVIDSIDSGMTGTAGDISNQSWGIDDFYTPAKTIIKGTY